MLSKRVILVESRCLTRPRRTILKGITTLLIVTIAFSPVTTFSQTRKRSTARRSSPRATQPQKAPDVQRDGAARVAEQSKTLTRSRYLLGGVAKGLEGD